MTSTTDTQTTQTSALPFNFRYAQNEDYGVRVTAAINAQVTVTAGAIEKLGAMIVTAYAQNVADLMGYDSWSEYVSAELHLDGFKPDAPARAFLVGMFRDAGLQFAEIAPVVKASVRTVKTDAEKQGTTVKRAPAAKPAQRGVTVVAPASDADVAKLHKILDGMTSDDLGDVAQYISQILRSRNAAGLKVA